MNNQLENKLYQIDPIFFEEAIACQKGKMNEMNTCMYFGCECRNGWFNPLKILAHKTAIINSVGCQFNAKFVCVQLKQKFGQLRCYTSIKKINEVQKIVGMFVSFAVKMVDLTDRI